MPDEDQPEETIPLAGEYPPLYLIRGQFLHELKKRIEEARGHEVSLDLAIEFAMQWDTEVRKTWSEFVKRKNQVLDILQKKYDSKDLPRSGIMSQADFTEEEIDDFIFLMKDYTGNHLSREEARADAWNMIQFMKWLYKVE